jgi:hypothetical protein
MQMTNMLILSMPMIKLFPGRQVNLLFWKSLKKISELGEYY